jgi:tetratricopeptide (TPR) repeat protein
MPIRRVLLGCATVLLTAHVLAAPPPPPPPAVPLATTRILDRSSYVQLAKQWQQYLDAHGETADGLVNLGQALDYCEEKDAAVNAARRAVELEPENPVALAFLGKMLSIWADDLEGAREVLARCRKLAPDYGYGLTMLATVDLKHGDLAAAEETFQTVYDQRIISRPLQDYAYNMLVGLPPGAVLVTGGDSDTFAALALQAGMGFRRDVVVINYSLLNVPAFAEAVFALHPEIRPRYDIEAHQVRMVGDTPTLLATALLEALGEEGKAPVFLSAALPEDLQGYRPAVHNEGLNNRVGAAGLKNEDVARMILETYRLDSATDWTEPWALAPSEARLMGNYVVAMAKLTQSKDVAKETRARLLERAGAIADFHDLTVWSTFIRDMRGR